jgi:hypothetical protein
MVGLVSSYPQPWNPGYIQDKQMNPRFFSHLGCIRDIFKINPGCWINLGYIRDTSRIYLGYIWDISGMYPGYIYIPDKFWIYPKYIPEYTLNISRIYSQIDLGFQGWRVQTQS